MTSAAWLTASTERVLTAPAGFGLSMATPLQRAICRTLDGQPLGALADDATVIKAFGTKPANDTAAPQELALFSGKRAGKTAIAAAFIAVCSQRIDVSGLLPGERVRIPVVSLSKDLAAQTFGHIRGAIEESAALRTLLASKPTADTIELRHPKGTIIEVVVTAGARAGASVAARWLGAVVFDEFPRMLGAADGAIVNWDHMRGEVVGRVLPGGCILDIGSPWAPFGPAYTMFLESHGHPSADLVTIKAPAYHMNPRWWTPERCADMKRRAPDRYATDVEAEFAAQEEQLFSDVELAQATRATPPDLPPNPLASYAAFMDPATRRNAWTLGALTREGGVVRTALARQWVGSRSEPLKPRKVLGEIAAALRPYGVSIVYTDRYYLDALVEDAAEFGLVLMPITLSAEEKVRAYLSLHARISMQRFELPPDGWVRVDMQRLKRRVTQSGVSIIEPQTSDGRHCDYAAMLALAAHHYLDDVQRLPPAPGTQEAYAAEEQRIWSELARSDRARRVA